MVVLYLEQELLEARALSRGCFLNPSWVVISANKVYLGNTTGDKLDVRSELEKVIQQLIDGLLVLHEPRFKRVAWHLLHAFGQPSSLPDPPATVDYDSKRYNLLTQP